ncbi:uncharacterized protein PGTG_09926 [Puccinia graminis f. sp. tritici CRL 75-36-700-3]|uniref:Uncharacterized protein n=1 Tax=Puccinia graminis f. sp. tritici (strain CRL 75-36-700-3 / race SCCL) TaxID=418459 RepID=E3KFD1_PUCGT|nr:uncharacterized protein PGTG_09926 [Puccinia graminis f. sp. tritici CRL 75-36-700-3]EFP82958.1 hypothetical protein PGTG_09926 [Puccinia graminis f. sp. tritici CRL 75-36-700-3]
MRERSSWKLGLLLAWLLHYIPFLSASSLDMLVDAALMVEAERPGRSENDRMDRDQAVKIETREQDNPEEAGPPSFIGNGPTEQNMNVPLVGTLVRKNPSRKDKEISSFDGVVGRILDGNTGSKNKPSSLERLSRMAEPKASSDRDEHRVRSQSLSLSRVPPGHIQEDHQQPASKRQKVNLEWSTWGRVATSQLQRSSTSESQKSLTIGISPCFILPNHSYQECTLRGRMVPN